MYDCITGASTPAMTHMQCDFYAQDWTCTKPVKPWAEGVSMDRGQV